MSPRRYLFLHDAVADAVRRRFPNLQVESDYPPGDLHGVVLDLKGASKQEQQEVLTFAKQYAKGWSGKEINVTLAKPSKK